MTVCCSIFHSLLPQHVGGDCSPPLLLCLVQSVGHPTAPFGGLFVEIVYPASQKDISRNTEQTYHMVGAKLHNECKLADSKLSPIHADVQAFWFQARV